MTILRPRLLAGLAGLALVLMGLAGCSSGSSKSGYSSTPPTQPSTTSEAPSTSLLPPRPAVLRLDGVDPCALLTPAQVRQFKTEPGKPAVNNDGLGSRECLWHGEAVKPDSIWNARAILTQGADYYLDSVTGSQISEVAGFPAVQTSSNIGDPATQCLLFVDVAPGQSLEVQYGNLAGDYPGISHQVACQQATKAAELMVANLRNLVH
jgi:hypothetical protein